MNKSITDYILHLADNALILGQRNSEWCGHGPVLEQDIAITNISLDLIGQARSLYQYAAECINQSNNDSEQVTEDSLAHLRDTRDFKNCLICELPNGDWGQTILRQFFFSSYQYLLYQQLLQSKDTTLAAIAEKSLKEVTYHVRWSSEWVIRLGDGTEKSYERMCKAIDLLWSYTGEFFMPADYETDSAIAVNVSLLQPAWQRRIEEVFAEATLQVPASEGKTGNWMQSGGKNGMHTEHMGFILAEMQFIQRAYPNSEW